MRNEEFELEIFNPTKGSCMQTKKVTLSKIIYYGTVLLSLSDHVLFSNNTFLEGEFAKKGFIDVII